MISENNNIDSSSIIKLTDIIHVKNKLSESWACLVQYKQIAEWVKTDKFSYYIAKNGNLIKISDAMNIAKEKKKEYIEEIENEMLNNEYYANEISVNLISSKHKLFFDEVNRTLTINTDFFDIAVVEGIYKCCAAVEAIKKNNDLCGTFTLKIMNLSVTSVLSYLRQQAKINVVSPDYWEKYNPDNMITKLITSINNYGNEDVNPLYKKIDLDFLTPNTLISFEMFKEGLEMSGFMDDIKNVKHEFELRKIEQYIVEFYNTFFKEVKKFKTYKNSNNVFTCSTIFMGLLITCHRYYKKKNYDTRLMIIGVKKIKVSPMKFACDYPIKRKEIKLWRNRFIRLFEKLDKDKNLNLDTIKVKHNKGNIINYANTFQTKGNQKKLHKYNNILKKSMENIEAEILSIKIDNAESLNPKITTSENKTLTLENSMKISKFNIDNNTNKLPIKIAYHLGMLGEKYIHKLLLDRNNDLLSIIGLANTNIKKIDWYNEFYDITCEEWEDKSIFKGHDIKIESNEKLIYLEIKTSYSNSKYYELTRNEVLANKKLKDAYYVIKIFNMKYYNIDSNKIKVEIVKNPIENLDKVRRISMYL